MIILEGGDCTGKSTFARLLQNILVKDYDKRLPMSHLTAETQPKLWTDYLDITPRIQDRWHLSGVVYQAMLGLHPPDKPVTHEQFCVIQRYLYWTGAIVVLLVDSSICIQTRMKEQADREELYELKTRLLANDCWNAIMPSSVDMRIEISGQGFPDKATAKRVIEMWLARRA